MHKLLLLCLSVVCTLVIATSRPVRAVCTGDPGDYNLCTAINNRCYSNCAKYGPPSPACTGQCDAEYDCCVFGGLS